jgi:hypothetical protein
VWLLLTSIRSLLDPAKFFPVRLKNYISVLICEWYLVPFVVEVKGSKFTGILREEDEGFSAQVIELPGCISEGKIKKKAIANIREAIERLS